MPSVGVLRLGTGNALAHWLGSGRPVHDLRRWNSGPGSSLRLDAHVRSRGNVLPFAGMGVDAAVLNDYNEIKQRARGQWWEKFAKGLSGYLIAGYTKTVPNYLRRSRHNVRITNTGRPAFRIAPNGREVGQPIPTGARSTKAQRAQCAAHRCRSTATA